jgi:imidazolonepropionase-like amidohydrolase
VLEHCRAAAKAALRAGITTVRDLGDRGYLTLKLREELKADPSTGPELLVAGPPITPSGGHCWFLGGEADGIDGVRQAVRDHAARGVDLIKVMVTGGEITPGSVPYLSQYGPDELRAIAEEAHALGLRVTGHAHGAQGVADAVAAGFDGIEHATFMTAKGVHQDPDLFNVMAARRVFVSVPVASTAAQPSPPPGSSVAKRFKAILAGLQTMRAAGVAITVSSDAGIAATKPHEVLPHGVAQIARNGFNTAEALRAVTSVAAESCGLGNRKGRIAQGYDADLLAVRGDPLTDPTDLRNVAAVFRAGKPIRRPDAVRAYL